ncbi:MAG TPA: rRNA maturation RNase YbeY [Humisphaera sp.]|jgi:probable rRNA maturation factor|nr:rRNA maturation RNase YbeY [Humisphaera sp.]
MSTVLNLSISARTGRQSAAILRRYLPKAHKLLRSPLRELSIALVGDAQMSELHERFMQIPGPTDVLTFPLDLDSAGRAVSGEVVVCVPYATREARKRGIPIEHEILLYALHGLLHLCGFDDRTESDFATMHRREDQILTRLGLGPVFAERENRKVSPPMKQPSRSRQPKSRRTNRRRPGA